MTESVVSYDLAVALVTAALEAAKSQGINGAAAVVDRGGHLVAFGRADKTSFLAFDVTRRKALTAACFGLPTRALAAFGAADPVVGADIAKQPNLCVVPGGMPIRLNGQVVGGLGLSGRTRPCYRRGCFKRGDSYTLAKFVFD